MKITVSLVLSFWLVVGPFLFGDVNARNGITISTSSTINGKTPNSAVNGLTVASGGGSTVIQFVAASTPYGSTNVPSGVNQNPITIPSTMTNGYIIFWVTCFDTNAVTSAQFDSLPMTALHSKTDGVNAKVFIYGVAVGSLAAGTYAVVPSFNGNLDYYTHGIIAYNNVHQTTQPNDFDGAFGSSTTASVTLTATSLGTMVVSAVYSDDADPMTPGAGQTQRQQLQHDIVGGASSDSPAGSTTPTMSWSRGNSLWVIDAVALNPAP